MNAQRIKNVQAIFVIGVVFFGIAIFCGMAAAGGSFSAAPFAIFFAICGATFFGAAFWAALFANIELRLMDIERKIGGANSDNTSAVTPADKPVQNNKWQIDYSKAEK